VGRKWLGLPTLLLAIAAACGPGEPPGPAPPDAPPIPEATAVDSAEPLSEAPPIRGVSPLAVGPEAFPHGEHRSVRCQVCHTSLPSHTTHGDVECTACHGVPEGYATLPIRSRDDCLNCHHDPGRGIECATCHGPEAGGRVSVLTMLDLADGTPPIERSLDFPHQRHAAWRCTTCHTEGVYYEVTRDCASCHASHHRPDNDCAACHRPARERHTLEAHLGCNSSGCHRQADLASLAEDRPACLICHPEQRVHEPGLPCAQCHAVGRLSAARSEPGRDPRAVA